MHFSRPSSRSNHENHRRIQIDVIFHGNRLFSAALGEMLVGLRMKKTRMKKMPETEQRFVFLGSQKGLFKRPLPPRQSSCAMTVPR